MMMSWTYDVVLGEQAVSLIASCFLSGAFGRGMERDVILSLFWG
jgi:hypothetical protein